MKSIISTLFLSINPSYLLLIVVIFLVIFILIKNGSIKICFDCKKGKLKIKVKKKHK